MNATTQITNEEALVAYINEIGNAEELLEYLGEFIDDHGDVMPDDVSNVHVQRMREVVARLAAIKQYIGG